MPRQAWLKTCSLNSREVCVKLSDSILGADCVEVSGWDEEEVFFVEKTRVAWDEFAGKHISLRRMLHEGAIVFLRMLPVIAQKQALPMVCKVEFIGCDPKGMHQFRLSSVQPSYSQEMIRVN
jgi:hypothetical protein